MLMNFLSFASLLLSSVGNRNVYRYYYLHIHILPPIYHLYLHIIYMYIIIILLTLQNFFGTSEGIFQIYAFIDLYPRPTSPALDPPPLQLKLFIG